MSAFLICDARGKGSVCEGRRGLTLYHKSWFARRCWRVVVIGSGSLGLICFKAMEPPLSELTILMKEGRCGAAIRSEDEIEQQFDR